MSAHSRRDARELRKRVVRLQAETARLELVAALGVLKHPRSIMAYKLPAMFESITAGKAGWAAATGAVIGSLRLQSLIKIIPLLLAGWRIARLARIVLARRRSAKADRA